MAANTPLFLDVNSSRLARFVAYESNPDTGERSVVDIVEIGLHDKADEKARLRALTKHFQRLATTTGVSSVEMEFQL